MPASGRRGFGFRKRRPTAAPAAAPLSVNTVAPAVTGTPQVGSVLTSSSGTWTNSPLSYNYYWYENTISSVSGASLLVGQTASTFTPGSGQLGKYIFSVVYASNANGPSASGAASNIVGSVIASPDVTAPTLSSPTATQTGANTASLGVTTNEANGTLYYVVTTSATPPTATQVKAGQDNAGAAAAYAGNQAILSTGAKTATASALAPSTTYYAYYMHEDAAGNKSTVAPSSSTTTTAGSYAVGAWTITKTADTPLAWGWVSSAETVAGDTIRMEWTKGGVAQTPVDEILDDPELIDGASLFPVTDFAGAVDGNALTWTLHVRRGGVQVSPVSNSISWTYSSALPPETASSWATASGVNKSQYVTVSGTGNLAAQGNGSGFGGAPHSVRASQPRTGARSFQVTQSNGPNSPIWLGIDDGTDDLGDTGTTNFSRPGKDNSSGVTIGLYNFQAVIWVGTVAVQTLAGVYSVHGDYSVEFDTTAGTVKFFMGSTQIGTTVTGLSALMAGGMYADCGFEHSAIWTAKFGTGQSRTLTSGFVPYDNP